MNDDVAISVNNVSKAYTIWRDPAARIKHPFLKLIGELFPPLRPKIDKKLEGLCSEFYALKNVSFDVKKGESVGIIGRNGSGKSTLLQIIAGTLQPTQGSVTVKGRVAALLELGSGFNPEFTGRENVYLNASILGLTRQETEERFAEIEAFADIGDFIDQPVKTYSSGMSVRLAFAVQSQVDPDVLIIDEALSVGDIRFQTKCFARLRQLQEKGTSILLITHSSEQIVTHCSRAMLLHDGKRHKIGDAKIVVNSYMDLLFGQKKKDLDVVNNKSPKVLKKTSYQLSSGEDLFFQRPGYNKYEYRWGDGAAAILDFYLDVENQPYPSTVITNQEVVLVFCVKFHLDIKDPIFGVTIKTSEGISVYGTNSELIGCPGIEKIGEKGTIVYLQAKFQCSLAQGDYFISVGIASKSEENIIPHDRRYDSIHMQVHPNKYFFGIADLNMKMCLEETE